MTVTKEDIQKYVLAFAVDKKKGLYFWSSKEDRELTRGPSYSALHPYDMAVCKLKYP